MARYFTTDKRYHCEPCDVWVSDQEMIPNITTSASYPPDTPGGRCPGCLDTMWVNIVIFGGCPQENIKMIAQVVA